MRCPRCHADNREDVRFCEDCGARLEQVCPSCGTALPLGHKFCGACGQPLAAPREAGEAAEAGGTREEPTAHAARGPMTPTGNAERRQLTVLFCDLVASTALSTTLDPEDLREVLRAYHEACALSVGRFEGHIAQYLGDGVLAYFGYPIAHEDDGERSVRAAMAIVQEMRPLNVRLREERGVSLTARLGIHTGLVVVGEIGERGKHENLALGDTPNISARVQAVAEPDTVVITAATHRLVRGAFDCQDLGSHTLKGVAAPLRLYRVLGENAARARPEAVEIASLSPLIDRREELQFLLERWERVKAGAGNVILLSGEAGIGKSRLGRAIRETVAHEGSPRIEYRCSAYHQNSALHPIIQHLQRVLKCDDLDPPDSKLAKLEEGLRSYRLPSPDVVPLLASLLSIPIADRYPPLNLAPHKQRQRTVEVLLTWMLEEAERQPLLFVVEDLHWGDPSTLDFLGVLVEQVPAARIFLLLTSRPDFTPAWAARSHVTRVALARLGAHDAEALVSGVAGGKALPAELLRQVVAKTDGVPLFVEELTKMVLESGLLALDESGYALTGPVPSLAIPATLHDSLMARLDRLASGKEVAQVAAVLGREFDYALLEAVAQLDDASLKRALALLVEAEFLLQRGFPPRSRYTFKHALIQDVAYQSSLKSRRQVLHRRIAQVLEEQFPHTIREQPEFLAHHYTEAGLAAQAIVYWRQAGQRAVERSANAEAISHLGHALDQLATQPETAERARQELEVQMLLARALMAARGMTAAEVERTYARARNLCEAAGLSDQLLHALGGLGTFYLVRGNVAGALELGAQCLDVAQRLDDPGLLLNAHAGHGTTLVFLGEFESSRAHFARGLQLAQAMVDRPLDFGGRDAGVGCLVFDAWAACLLGRPDEASASLDTALTLAGKLSHPFSLAFALTWAARLHQFRREERLCLERAEQAIAISVEYGFTQWLAIATILRGWALTREGRADEGIGGLREGLAAWQAIGAELLRPYFLALLADAYQRVGRPDEGLATVLEALTLLERTGERMYEAELRRLHGELLRACDPGPASTDTAHACFRRALDVARRQGARALELRAAMSLGRLFERAEPGGGADARRALAEVYATFTGGFETADLCDAKTMLEPGAGARG